MDGWTVISWGQGALTEMTDCKETISEILNLLWCFHSVTVLSYHSQITVIQFGEKIINTLNLTFNLTSLTQTTPRGFWSASYNNICNILNMPLVHFQYHNITTHWNWIVMTFCLFWLDTTSKVLKTCHMCIKYLDGPDLVVHWPVTWPGLFEAYWGFQRRPLKPEWQTNIPRSYMPQCKFTH